LDVAVFLIPYNVKFAVWALTNSVLIVMDAPGLDARLASSCTAFFGSGSNANVRVGFPSFEKS
jgi:hypothetical protein